MISTLLAQAIVYTYSNLYNIKLYNEKDPILKTKILYNLYNLCLGILLPLVYIKNSMYTEYTSLSSEVWNVFIYALCMEYLFYMVHYYMHHSTIVYKSIHYIHHTERQPNVIDAYYLHPFEAIAIIGVLWTPLFFVQISEIGLMLLQTVYLVVTILEHGGLKNNQIHMRHHFHYNCNFCAIIPIWDIVFDTYKES